MIFASFHLGKEDVFLASRVKLPPPAWGVQSRPGVTRKDRFKFLVFYPAEPDSYRGGRAGFWGFWFLGFLVSGVSGFWFLVFYPVEPDSCQERTGWLEGFWFLVSGVSG